ncbi:MAG TPA: glycosyltransferase family 4 protein [Anaerolineae bacterium]|nr:glycosyltransferase family 4 protein [Anaerolineae bacterium]HQH38553.1 glycosyltransferase family 4 protein [Anaerolineae bacterium]
MRILHIIQRYWPVRGGAEVHFGAISAYLAAQGHEVTVATTDALDFELFWNPRCRRVVEHEARQDGVRILRFPVRHLPVPTMTYPGIRRLLWLLSMAHPLPVALLTWLSRFTPWVPDLWRWLQTTDATFDLVAGMNICFEPLLEAGWHFARRRGVPFVIYPLTHLGAGLQPGEDALGRFYTMRHQVDLVLRSDMLVAQTPTERDFYVKRGLPSERALVIGPGVTPTDVLGGDAQRFRQRHHIPPLTPLVLALSAMAYDKGTVHVVEAIRRLWRQGRAVELVLAGALLTPFAHYMEHLPALDRERIHVLGPVSEEEKRDALAAADIFALPSRTDSFGIVYLEAWLYRKPVIGARTWGVTDVIADGEDGCLVPFGDVSALADTIAFLADHPETRAAMGAHGEQKVYTHHTWTHKHALVQRLYLDLVKA